MNNLFTEKEITTYINRYGDKINFIRNHHNSIIMGGEINYCSISYPNLFQEAYDKYVENNPETSIDLNTFKTKISEYDIDFGYDPDFRDYQKYIKSDTTTLLSVDPSGGPYIYVGLDMGCIKKEWRELIVKKIKPMEKGYMLEI